MLRSVLPLSFIIATRFFGLFIVLPVLSLYALELESASANLIGLLVGIYAIMQVIFQLPFGVLSDKIGRKNAMAIGLILFIIGSLICARSLDIYTMLFGRALQGVGAVGAVATAMISDFVKEEERGKAMAIMGALIGLSFASSMILSPILSYKFGLSSLFNLSAFLSVICIIMLYLTIPKEPKITHHGDKFPLTTLLRDKNLALMNLTNFLQKTFMSMAFFAIPIVLVNSLGFERANLYKVYILATIFGFLAMGISGAFGEKRGFGKQILLAGVVFFILSYAVFAISKSPAVFIAGVVLFFIGFNMHEPIMQSLASKFAKSSQKGSVLGIFNSIGFFGSFVGGVFGGILMSRYGLSYLAIFVSIIAVVWFVLLLYLTNPNCFVNLYLKKDENIDPQKIKNIDGIIDIYELNDEFVVKFNKFIIEKDEILAKIYG